MQEIQQHEAMMNEVREQQMIKSFIENGFSSYSTIDSLGTSYFNNAYNEIEKMLKGNIPQNLGKALFLTENAYYENKYDYKDFQSAIKEKIRLINLKIEEEKHDKNSNLVKNMMLFRLLSDTLRIKDKANKQTLTHLPIKYDYEDYKSQINYDSHFVAKLMQTGKGQCYSMPLYYLVLAEEIGADAYWSFSPKHSFVKIQDDENRWFNIELTCKAILSDAHII